MSRRGWFGCKPSTRNLLPHVRRLLPMETGSLGTTRLFVGPLFLCLWACSEYGEKALPGAAPSALC